LRAGTSGSDGSGEKVTLLSADGQLVEVDRASIRVARKETREQIKKSHLGIPGRKFVMVLTWQNARMPVSVL
jgi:hypothetical protein